MKVVVDTNVFMSGIFFSGPPYEILRHWQKGKLKLVVSPEILDEYRRVGEELSEKYPDVDVGPFLELLALHSSVVDPLPLEEQVCSDSEDDKFLACAIASHARIICSGDKALLKTSGYQGVKVLTPRQLVDEHLQKTR